MPRGRKPTVERDGKFDVGSISFGADRPVFIVGPCVIESPGSIIATAEYLAEIAKRRNLQLVFKASIDKANRSKLKSFRGIGWPKGLEALREVKKRTKLPITTDIHEAWQAADVAEVADIIQIPALLCRQTDLLVAAGKTGRAVNIKKGQNMAPWDMANVVEKVREQGNRHVILTERGSAFGYNRVVTDLRAIAHMKSLGCPVIFDASHSNQMPGITDELVGVRGVGEWPRAQIRPMARAAVAFGCDGVFVEVHPEPDAALSDPSSSLPLSEFEGLVDDVIAIRRALGFWEQ